MAEKTNIEWCDRTFNPVRGCTKVSEGCAHCYADTLSQRNPALLGIWGPHGTRIIASPSMWAAPRKWNDTLFRECPRCGWRGSTDCQSCQLVWGEMIPTRQRVFCASLADIFEDWQGMMHFPDKEDEDRGISTAWWRRTRGIVTAGGTTVGLIDGDRIATFQDVRDKLFTLIEETPNLDWLLLTKRPQNVLRMVPEKWRSAFPSNVWMGTTAENQQRADERIPHLLQIPAKIRFLSCEPLLGPLDLTDLVIEDGQPGECHLNCLDNEGLLPEDDPAFKGETIHWVIAGGESGPGARPMHPAWLRSLRDQCAAAEVSFLFKQHGDWMPSADAHAANFIGSDVHHPWGTCQPSMTKIGKNKAARLLDGRTHHQFPTPKHP